MVTLHPPQAGAGPSPGSIRAHVHEARPADTLCLYPGLQLAPVGPLVLQWGLWAVYLSVCLSVWGTGGLSSPSR